MLPVAHSKDLVEQVSRHADTESKAITKDMTGNISYPVGVILRADSSALSAS